MPCIQRRPAILDFRQHPGIWRVTRSDGALNRQVVIVGEHYKQPQEEVDFLFTKLARKSNFSSQHKLSISSLELQDHYKSSEEDSISDSEEEERDDEETESGPMLTASERRVHFATAVPMFLAGRPKLVDVASPATSPRSSSGQTSVSPVRSKEIVPGVWLSSKTSHGLR